MVKRDFSLDSDLIKIRESKFSDHVIVSAFLTLTGCDCRYPMIGDLLLFSGYCFNFSTRWKKHLSINQSPCNYDAPANKSPFYQLFILRPHSHIPSRTIQYRVSFQAEALKTKMWLHFIVLTLSLHHPLPLWLAFTLSPLYPPCYDGHASVKDIWKWSRQQQNTLSSHSFCFSYTFLLFGKVPFTYSNMCVSVLECVSSMPLYSKLEKWNMSSQRN